MMSALNQSLNSTNQGDIAAPNVVVPISTMKVTITMTVASSERALKARYPAEKAINPANAAPAI